MSADVSGTGSRQATRCTHVIAGICSHERVARRGRSGRWRWCSKAGECRFRKSSSPREFSATNSQTKTACREGRRRTTRPTARWHTRMSTCVPSFTLAFLLAGIHECRRACPLLLSLSCSLAYTNVDVRALFYSHFLARWHTPMSTCLPSFALTFFPLLLSLS